MMMVSLKEQKEASVTGHEGTSPQELLLICVVAPVISYWLYVLVSLEKDTNATTIRASLSSSSSSSSSLMESIYVEAIILWLPMILCQSVFLYPFGILNLVSQIVIAIGLEVVTRRRRQRRRTMQRKDSSKLILTERSNDPEKDSEKDSFGYVTVYRCMGLYMTFVAILAVDFPLLFPRRFVKTETHGYGLMDLGASFSVMAAGMCSSRARQSIRQRTQARPRKSPWTRIIRSRMAPLLFMGLLRLIVHGGIEYQEHASEYGTHWNFFFTLAMLSVGPKLVVSSLSRVSTLSSTPTWIVPFLIMMVYQYALEFTFWPLSTSSDDDDNNSSSSSSSSATLAEIFVPLQRWIEEAPRPGIAGSDGNSGFEFLRDFAVSNREGLLGCIGYTALYLASEWIGYAFVWTNRNGQTTSSSSSVGLWLLGLALVLLWRLSVHGLGLDCSRRSTNAIFICWTLVVNVLTLAALQTIHYYYYDLLKSGRDDDDKSSRNNIKPRRPSVLIPVVWAAVNRHGLLCFIAANLLTGILNLSIPNMLEVSAEVALVILVAYVTAVGLLALLLDRIMGTTVAAHPIQEENTGIPRVKSD